MHTTVAQHRLEESLDEETAKKTQGSSMGPAKVKKVKIFSGPCYMIKCVLSFVSGVQKSVLVDFISQDLSKSSLSTISSQKRTNLYFLNIFLNF